MSHIAEHKFDLYFYFLRAQLSILASIHYFCPEIIICSKCESAGNVCIISSDVISPIANVR